MTGPAKAVSALDVARAALMEVGLEPTVIQLRGATLVTSSTDRLVARAGWLAIASTYGPDQQVSCAYCNQRSDLDPCTPVRDVLRGVTCGRAA